jgi:thiol-disulfide isomerase/thioredoxin
MSSTTLLLCSLLSFAPQAIAPQATTVQAKQDRPFALMLGDPAPAIQVAEWVQGKPVARFEPGSLYVVEFWATWCGPCKVAIPHLNELSKTYAGKVQFIGVSVSEQINEKEAYWVPRFVQEMGDKMTYTVASDRVKADDPPRMNESWMRAAGQNGIPTAFVVNGEGKVAWIGHPMKMDKPLAEIVAGTWDLAAAAKAHASEMRVKGLSAQLNKDISKAKKDKDFAGAVKMLDEALAKEPTLEASFGLNKYFLLVEAQRTADAAAYGKRLVAQVIADNPMALNSLAWSIVDPATKMTGGDYGLAVLAAERAVKLQEEKDASTLDTLGLALFKAGQIERAIAVQEKAVGLAKGQDKLELELKARLEEFKGAKKNL